MFIALSLALAADCSMPDGANNAQQAGIHWAQRGELGNALPCFEQAVLAPTVTTADHYNLGSMHHDLGNQSLAEGAQAAGMNHIAMSKVSFDRAIASGTVPDEIIALQSGNLAMLGDYKASTEILASRLPMVINPKVRADFVRRLGDLAQVPFPEGAKAQQFDSHYRTGADLVSPAMNLEDRTGSVDEVSVAKGLSELSQALQSHPRSWQTLWIIGKGHESLGDDAAAKDAFTKAYALNPWNPDVGRELVNVQLRQGDATGAVQSDALVQLHPTDPTLLANHALVLLMRGDTKSATTWVAKSLAIAPTDPITLKLKQTIDAVAAGNQAAPEHL